ncbi:MAG: hypothetical protein ACYC7D_05125 [Nitrososphaerales archaeon]
MRSDDILSSGTKMLGAIALIEPLPDRVGIREIVDQHAPMERNVGSGRISNGEAVDVMIMNRLPPQPLYSGWRTGQLDTLWKKLAASLQER